MQGVKALLTALKLWMKKEVRKSETDFVCYFGELCFDLEISEGLCPSHI